MGDEALIYTIRPDKTALWLPSLLCEHLGISYGQELTQEQYGGAAIQEVIGLRRSAEAERGRGGRK